VSESSGRVYAGNPTASLVEGLTTAGHVASSPAASNYFYYVDTGTATIHRGTTKSPYSGGILISGLNAPDYLVTDGVNLYWSDDTDVAIYRAPVTGGTPFALAKSLSSVAVGLAVDNTYIYVATTTQILRIPK